MEDTATLLRFYKALAGSAHNVQDLAAALQLKEPTVSHHLAILREAGLVTMRAEGTVHWYRLDLDAMRASSRSMLSRENLAALAAAEGADDFERKVLSSFLDGEKIKDIPVPRKKRLVILRWLAHRLDEKATYTENQLNAIIKRHHWDTATIRRDMVGYRMLARNQGVYRRMPESEWRSEAKWDGRGRDDPSAFRK